MRVIASAYPTEIILTGLNACAVRLRCDELLRLQPLEIKLNSSSVLDLAPCIQRDRNIDLAAGRIDEIQLSVLRCAGVVADLNFAVRCEVQLFLHTGKDLCIPVEVILPVVDRIVIILAAKMRILFAEVGHGVESAVQHNTDIRRIGAESITAIFKEDCIPVILQRIDLGLQVNECRLNIIDIIFIDTNTGCVVISLVFPDGKLC